MSCLICTFLRSYSSHLLISHMPKFWSVCVLRLWQCCNWGLWWSSGMWHASPCECFPKLASASQNFKGNIAFIPKSQVDHGELVHLALENKGDAFLSNSRRRWPHDEASHPEDQSPCLISSCVRLSCSDDYRYVHLQIMLIVPEEVVKILYEV
jgi:hypothetical protein